MFTCRDSCQLGYKRLSYIKVFRLSGSSLHFSVLWQYIQLSDNIFVRQLLFRQSTQLVWFQLSFYISLSSLSSRSENPIQLERCDLGERSVC